MPAPSTTRKKNKTRLSKTMNDGDPLTVPPAPRSAGNDSGPAAPATSSSSSASPQKKKKSNALTAVVEYVSNAFDQVDTQRRGFIPSGQLRALLECLGAAPQPLDQIRSMALLLDPDYSDKIKKQDFLRFWITREMAPKRERGGPPSSVGSSSAAPSSSESAAAAAAGGGGGGTPGSRGSSKGRGKGKGRRSGGAGTNSSGGGGGFADSPASTNSTNLVADLTEAARARKEAQENAKMLANRVAMLREEKLKTIRCIADANRQAEKITAFKQKQEARRQERRELGRIQEKKERQAHKRFAERKKLNLLRKTERSEEIYKQKMEVAAAVRKQKQAAQKDKRRMERQYQHRARETHAGVQKLHRSLRQKKAELAQKQAEAGHKAYEEKIRKEERLRRKNEKSISALEEEEAGLIQELQNAQLMQEDALSGLQYLLSTRVVGTE